MSLNRQFSVCVNQIPVINIGCIREPYGAVIIHQELTIHFEHFYLVNLLDVVSYLCALKLAIPLLIMFYKTGTISVRPEIILYFDTRVLLIQLCIKLDIERNAKALTSFQASLDARDISFSVAFACKLGLENIVRKYLFSHGNLSSDDNQIFVCPVALLRLVCNLRRVCKLLLRAWAFVLELDPFDP